MDTSKNRASGVFWRVHLIPITKLKCCKFEIYLRSKHLHIYVCFHISKLTANIETTQIYGIIYNTECEKERKPNWTWNIICHLWSSNYLYSRKIQVYACKTLNVENKCVTYQDHFQISENNCNKPKIYKICVFFAAGTWHTVPTLVFKGTVSWEMTGVKSGIVWHLFLMAVDDHHKIFILWKRET